MTTGRTGAAAPRSTGGPPAPRPRRAAAPSRAAGGTPRSRPRRPPPRARARRRRRAGTGCAPPRTPAVAAPARCASGVSTVREGGTDAASVGAGSAGEAHADAPAVRHLAAGRAHVDVDPQPPRRRRTLEQRFGDGVAVRCREVGDDVDVREVHRCGGVEEDRPGDPAVPPLVLVLDEGGVRPLDDGEPDDVGPARAQLRGHVELARQVRVLAHADVGPVDPHQQHALRGPHVQHDAAPGPARRNLDLALVDPRGVALAWAGAAGGRATASGRSCSAAGRRRRARRRSPAASSSPGPRRGSRGGPRPAPAPASGRARRPRCRRARSARRRGRRRGAGRRASAAGSTRSALARPRGAGGRSRPLAYHLRLTPDVVRPASPMAHPHPARGGRPPHGRSRSDGKLGGNRVKDVAHARG